MWKKDLGQNTSGIKNRIGAFPCYPIGLQITPPFLAFLILIPFLWRPNSFSYEKNLPNPSIILFNCRTSKLAKFKCDACRSIIIWKSGAFQY